MINPFVNGLRLVNELKVETTFHSRGLKTNCLGGFVGWNSLSFCVCVSILFPHFAPFPIFVNQVLWSFEVSSNRFEILFCRMRKIFTCPMPLLLTCQADSLSVKVRLTQLSTSWPMTTWSLLLELCLAHLEFLEWRNTLSFSK